MSMCFGRPRLPGTKATKWRSSPARAGFGRGLRGDTGDVRPYIGHQCGEMIVAEGKVWRWIMRAEVGDRIVIRSHRVGEPERDAEILETGADGEPPFRVRWGDTGHVGLFFPGSDAYVDHLHEPASALTEGSA